MIHQICRIAFLPCILYLASCSYHGEVVLPSSTGKHGEIVVVIKNRLWETETGQSIKNSLAKEHLALPQQEPFFDLVNIPEKAFSDIFKTHRNILLVESGNTAKTEILFKKNLWANPQTVVKISSANSQELAKLILENRFALADYFFEEEQKSLMNSYALSEEKSVSKKLIKSHQLSLTVPKGYEIAVEKDNFLWLRFETAEISRGILIYYNAYTDSNEFSINNIIALRDSMTKMYVPGSRKGSYMTVYNEFPPVVMQTELNGMYSTEVRGLWNVKGDFMGGPFLSYTVLDKKRNMVITVDGFIYAPNSNKRNYIRQVQAILCSLR